VSLTKQARTEVRQPARQELQGADTCTVKRNGYEGHASSHGCVVADQGCGNRLIGYRYPEP